MPCTFGTQLNVFSRESSSHQSVTVLRGFTGFFRLCVSVYTILFQCQPFLRISRIIHNPGHFSLFILVIMQYTKFFFDRYNLFTFIQLNML